MPLTGDRDTKKRDGKRVGDPVAADTTIFAGALYALNATGNAVPAGTVGAGPARAVAVKRADNTDGDAGDIRVDGERGVFAFANSEGADEIERDHIGQVAWIVDDETVALTDDDAARQAAGLIVDVDEYGVWVEVGIRPIEITIEDGGGD